MLKNIKFFNIIKKGGLMMASAKKILLLGAGGMLGSDLSELLKKNKKYSLTEFFRKDLDLEEKNEKIIKKILAVNPEIIINAAAYTNVDLAETEKQKAIKINADAISSITLAARKLDALLVHYSTDYVFSGTLKTGYLETTTGGFPKNFYGLSKWLGENQIIYSEHNKYYIIRTSWLFGKNGKNFVKTILDLSEKQKEIRVVDDQFGKPTYTKDLAEKTIKIIESNTPCGIYHLVNENKTSWYKFAKKIIALSKSKKNTKIIPCSTAEFPRPAERPSFSILLNTKIEKMRRWQDALKDYLKEINII